MLDKIILKIEKNIPEKWRGILNHDGFKRYFANTGWMFLGQVFYLGVSFLVGAWIARYLGPNKYGLVSYVIAFTGLFSFIGPLGVDGILNRELVSHPEKRDELLGTSFRLKIIGSILAFVTATVFAFIFNGLYSLTSWLIIMFSVSFFFQAPNVIATFFYAQVKAKENIKAQIIAAVASSMLKVGLILLGGDIIWLLIIYIFDYVWQAIFLVKFYNQQGLKIRSWKFEAGLAKSIWRDSWPLMLSAIASFAYLRIDQVMIGKIMGETAVGIYAAAVKITEVFYFLPIIICGSLFPAIVNARNADIRAYYRRLKNLYVLIGVLGFLVALPIMLLAAPVISFIFGSQYLAAVPILQIYIWSSVGLFLGAVVNNQLMAENRTRAVFAINFTAMAVNVVLNIILIPKIGLIGSALATLAAYSIASIWLLFFGVIKSRKKY
ncbi:MAG: flippase [Candidatus Falkowbacteria bacterium]|nr:MAG: flippase [Candidatus Falkowbacteria bacterium]